MLERLKTDILILGSGGAGLFAALHAHQAAPDAAITVATKGLLGKKVNLLAADSGAKPNQAVQEIQTFINQHKIILMTGSTSSAVAVALNKFAQREKVLYVTGMMISAFAVRGLG